MDGWIRERRNKVVKRLQNISYYKIVIQLYNVAVLCWIILKFEVSI